MNKLEHTDCQEKYDQEICKMLQWEGGVKKKCHNTS